MKVEVRRDSYFKPLAKEHEANLVIDHKRDVTGNSRTQGTVDDFVALFRNRYEKLAKIFLKMGRSFQRLADAKRSKGDVASVVVMVRSIKTTKKGNILLEIEDLSGTFKAVISSKDELLLSKASKIIKDEVIYIKGKVLEPFIIVEEFAWPDLPVIKDPKRVDVDLAVAYISDIHFGSKYFLEKYFDAFIDWLLGKSEERTLAGKVKYIAIAGDVVDGVGIYPRQEKELAIKDIFKQYALFDRFLERIPDYIEVIVCPGNHDAVRRGEPQPSLGKDLFTQEVHRVGNPASFSIEGLKHLMYHGTSMDSMIANIPGLSYSEPEKVMAEYLKRRHLSPIYGEGANPIIPEKVDYMVIEDPPDVFHAGHVHKNGYMTYRGTLVINSGTFQDQTEYQIKQGHIPTPAIVPIYRLKTGQLVSIDFKY